MKKYKLTAFAAVTAALLLSGCASNKGAYSGDIQDDEVTTGEVSASASTSTGSAASSSQAAAPAKDEREGGNSLLQQRVVYFDYDKSFVREGDLPILHAHGDFLARNSGLGVVLSGHTDERGSNEYNLALGQRRADAVRDVLLTFGVSSDQIESLSFGEEQPAAEGQNETAWQLNRRVDIRYTDE